MRRLALLVVLFTACGGSQDVPPKPLDHHFDDMFIAQVPIDQMTDVTNRQKDWSIAKRENAKAEADFNDAANQLEAAKNDAKKAHLDADTANANKATADASHDTNKINDATKSVHVSGDLAKALDTRVHYFEAYRDFLKENWLFTQHMMYWREAQYELAKSSLGQKANVSPQGVTYAWFPDQESARAKATTAARDRAEAAHKHALDVRGQWIELQKTADTESGHPVQLFDPMVSQGNAGNP